MYPQSISKNKKNITLFLPENHHVYNRGILKYITWACFLNDIYIRFGSKLYRQNVGIPMGTNCAPLVADLFLFCYERDFIKSLKKEKRYDLIDAFNSTSRYLDDLLNIDNNFEHMVHRIYPAELQLNKANASDTEAAFLDLNLSIHNDIVCTKIYDKRDDFNFDIVIFPFLDGVVPQRPSYGVYIYISTYSLCQSIFACY